MRILLIPALLTLSSNGPNLLPLKLLASVYNSSIFCIVIWYPLHEMFPVAVLVRYCFYSQSAWVCCLATAAQGGRGLSFAKDCCGNSINLPFLNSNWSSPHPWDYFSSLYYAKFCWKPWVSFSFNVLVSEESDFCGISTLDFIDAVYHSDFSCCPAAAASLLWNTGIYTEVIKKLLSPPMCC